MMLEIATLQWSACRLSGGVWSR